MAKMKVKSTKKTSKKKKTTVTVKKKGTKRCDKCGRYW